MKYQMLSAWSGLVSAHKNVSKHLDAKSEFHLMFYRY